MNGKPLASFGTLGIFSVFYAKTICLCTFHLLVCNNMHRSFIRLKYTHFNVYVSISYFQSKISAFVFIHTHTHTYPLHDFLSQIAVIPYKCIVFTHTYTMKKVCKLFSSNCRKLPWNGLSEKQCNCHSITTKEAHASYNRKRIKCMLASHPWAWNGRERPQLNYFNAFHSCGFVYVEWRKDRFSERHQHKRYQFSLPCSYILYVYFDTFDGDRQTQRETMREY